MGALVFLSWPDLLIRPFGAWYDALLGRLGLQVAGAFYRTGHLAALLVSEKDGRALYFDFGRYHCPPGTGRVRDAESDPNLATAVRVRFNARGDIDNIKELLDAVGAIPAVRVRGRMEAEVLSGVDFPAAFAAAKALQARGPLRYGNFSPGAMNCARFLLTLARFGPLGSWGRLRLRLAWMLGPLIRCLRRGGPAPSQEEVRGVGAMIAPVRPPGLPSEARWLPCLAVGAWISLSPDPGGSGRFRVRRFSSAGVLEFDSLMELEEGELDLAEGFEFDLPTHALVCSIRRGWRSLRLRTKR